MSANPLVADFVTEYARYRAIGEKAMAQVPEAGLNKVMHADANSIAMLVRHVSGNFISRFTDFLSTDGEKPWRDREAEFVERSYTRADMDALWMEGWRVLEGQLAGLTDAHLAREVRIRGAALTVHAALSRSLAHVAYHVGQIVLLARLLHSGEWQWISIPKGASAAYNANPTREMRP